MKLIFLSILFLSCVNSPAPVKRSLVFTQTVQTLSRDLTNETAVRKTNDSIVSSEIIKLKTTVNVQAKKISSLELSKSAAYTNINILLKDMAVKTKAIQFLAKTDTILTTKVNVLVKDTALKGQLIRFLQLDSYNQQKSITSQSTRINSLEDSIDVMVRVLGTDFTEDKYKRIKISQVALDRIKEYVKKP